MLLIAMRSYGKVYTAIGCYGMLCMSCYGMLLNVGMNVWDAKGTRGCYLML